MQKLRLGSLFDGIGGFPLAAAVCGMEPVWASEIEPFPIEVTRLRFPGMLHVGDITKLRGAELPRACGQVSRARGLACSWSSCV